MTEKIQPFQSRFFAPFIFCAAIFLCVVGTGTGARAMDGALMTGEALGLLCNSPKPDDQFSCQSYIAGVIDYHRLIKSLGTAPSVDFCLPQGVRMDQLKAVVTQYILTHTEHQNFIAAPAVAMSLYGAYPCKKKRR